MDNAPMNPVMSLPSNITSIGGFGSRQHGAVIHSVAHVQEHRVHYGVQSATFIRTVFPGQASGTYRINSPIPWRGAQITADFTPAGANRTAGSPPVPYPPKNASAFYSPPQTRIVPNPCFRAWG